LIRRTLEQSFPLRPGVGDLPSFVDITTHVTGALVAASVQQARSPLTLRLFLLDASALVEIDDSCIDFPPMQARQQTGSARHFVEQAVRSSSAWGYQRLPGGRRLWARVDACRQPRASAT
jgi:hypothetical protein